MNMFAQYLFLARVQFLDNERIRHPGPHSQRVGSTIANGARFGS